MKIFNILSKSKDANVEKQQNNPGQKNQSAIKELNEDEISLNFVYKTKMDLIVNAPLIIIPQNSKSRNAVLIDCGKICTKTSLSILHEYSQATETKNGSVENTASPKIENKNKIPPIIEKQRIELFDVKILKLAYSFILIFFFNY